MKEINSIFEGADLQRAGRYFLNKACFLISESNFNKASIFIKLGLDLITCDCIKSWKIDVDKDNIFNDISIPHYHAADYFLCKAFTFGYETSEKELYLGIDAIDKYIKISGDHYGLYIRGRILLSMKQYNFAIECFEQAQSICSSSRNLYRIGRTKEEFTNSFGLVELYKSYLSNMNSVCCGNALQRNTLKKAHTFDLSHPSISGNILSNAFCKNNGEFSILLKECIDTRSAFLNEFGNILFDNDFLFLENIEEICINNHEYNHPPSCNNDYNRAHDANDYAPEFDDEFANMNYYSRKKSRSSNPWQDVFGPGEEADAAYWNTE